MRKVRVIGGFSGWRMGRKEQKQIPFGNDKKECKGNRRDKNKLRGSLRYGGVDAAFGRDDAFLRWCGDKW
jgi:hypothetical protein